MNYSKRQVYINFLRIEIIRAASGTFIWKKVIKIVYIPLEIFVEKAFSVGCFSCFIKLNKDSNKLCLQLYFWSNLGNFFKIPSNKMASNQLVLALIYTVSIVFFKLLHSRSNVGYKKHFFLSCSGSIKPYSTTRSYYM